MSTAEHLTSENPREEKDANVPPAAADQPRGIDEEEVSSYDTTTAAMVRLMKQLQNQEKKRHAEAMERMEQDFSNRLKAEMERHAEAMERERNEFRAERDRLQSRVDELEERERDHSREETDSLQSCAEDLDADSVSTDSTDSDGVNLWFPLYLEYWDDDELQDEIQVMRTASSVDIKIRGSTTGVTVGTSGC